MCLTAHTSTETFLALLQLLEQTKVARHFCTHDEDGGMGVEEGGGLYPAIVGLYLIGKVRYDDL